MRPRIPRRLISANNLEVLRPIFRAFMLVVTYAIWILSLRMFTLTLVTYFVTSPTSHFQDIIEVLASNEISLMGISALLFLILVVKMNPLTSTSFSAILNRKSIEKQFLPSFARGAFFAGTLVLLFVLSGTYRYLGYYIQFQETPLSLASILFRIFTLIAFAYCEGFIFFHKVPLYLKKRVPEFAQVHLIAILFCVIKALQFEFDFFQWISLYLLAIALYYRSQNKGEFGRGAGFWAAFLVIFQPVLSLPLFGNDFSGILLVKYPSVDFEAILNPNPAVHFLTGGAEIGRAHV